MSHLRTAAARLLFGLVPLFAGSCADLRPGFLCAADEECAQGGVHGRCEPAFYCSFPDLNCSSGQRYGTWAGGLSGQCVSATEDGGPEAGADGPADAADDAPAPGDAAPDGPAAAFVVGYNFGDDAPSVVIDGRDFAAQGVAGSASLRVEPIGGIGGVASWTTYFPPDQFVPPVDQPRADLLNHHFSVHDGGITITQGLTNGTYVVSTYHLENNADYWRSYNLAVQGTPVTTEPVSLPQYHWVKLGPYEAEVIDGMLSVELLQITSDASIAGLEIWTTTGGVVQPLP
jgi:hypothetical protein